MNIEKSYYSRGNFDKLHSTVKSFIERKYGVDVKERFQDNLFKTMEVVEQKGGLSVQAGFDKNTYLELMNRKVLKVALSQIKDDFSNLEQNKQKKQKKQNNNAPKQNLHRSEDQFDPKIPHPIISTKDNMLMERFEELNNLRDDSPSKKISFIRKDQDTADKNAGSKYEQLINQRKLEGQKKEKPSELDKFFSNTVTKNVDTDEFPTIASSMASFADNNSAMNEHLANIDHEIDINKIIPGNVAPQIIKDIDDHMTNIHDIHSNTRSDNGMFSSENFNIQHDMIKKDDENKETFKNIMKYKEGLDGSYPLIKESNVEYKERKHILTVDSIDRDLENYTDPTDFRVQFNAESNSRVLIEKNVMKTVGDKEISVIFYKGEIKYEGIRAAPILTTYKNIKSIKLCGTMMPVSKNGIYTFDDEPYFLINIPELDPTYDGTNIASNNAFSKISSKEYTRFTNNNGENLAKFALLKNMENSPFIYSPAPLANLNSLTLQVKTNRNDIYSIGNDKINVIALSKISSTDCGDEILKVFIRLKRHQGMNEQDMVAEAIGNETLYFYCKNTCYNNQYFNFDILDDNIKATIEVDGDDRWLVVKQTLCDPGSDPGPEPYPTKNIIFSHLINKNQILKISNGTGTVTGFYKFTGEINNDRIKIKLISGTNIITDIKTIKISEINNKGFVSDNCNDINYNRGFKILPYTIETIAKCPGNDTPINFLSNTTIDLNIISNYNDTYTSTNDKLQHENNITALGHSWNPSLSESEIKNHLINDKCIESYYYQTFSMAKPKNFDITAYQMNDIFFIRKKKQISYTFEITTVEQNRGIINTKII